MIAFPFCRTRRGGSTWRPAAPAIEQFVEWSSPKSSEFLASPGGKLPGLTALRNRQDWLMRGGDRLVNECSWMSSICSRLHHSTYCCGVFKRSLPLISHDKISVPRCRYFIVTASPRGKPRTQKILACTIHRTALLRGRRCDPQFSPLPCRCRRRWQRLPHPQPPRWSQPEYLPRWK